MNASWSAIFKLPVPQVREKKGERKRGRPLGSKNGVRLTFKKTTKRQKEVDNEDSPVRSDVLGTVKVEENVNSLLGQSEQVQECVDDEDVDSVEWEELELNSAGTVPLSKKKKKPTESHNGRLDKNYEQRLQLAVLERAQLGQFKHHQGRAPTGWKKLASTYSIPVSTIRYAFARADKETGALKEHGNKALPSSVEEAIVKHCQMLGDMGFALGVDDIYRLAEQCFESLPVSVKSSKTFKATDGWYRNLLARFPGQLSLRATKGLKTVRANALNPNNIAKWFELLARTYRSIHERNAKLGFQDPSLEASHVFNLDETGFVLSLTRKVGVFRTGSKTTIRRTNNSQELVTFLACVSAAGGIVPPYFCIKGKRLSEDKRQEILRTTSQQCKISMTPNGWTSEGVFGLWCEHFVKYLDENLGERRKTVLLVLDGHDSHLSQPIPLTYLHDHGVVVACMPSHTSSVLQPVDVGIFSAVKARFRRMLDNEFRSNPAWKVDKWSLPTLSWRAFVDTVNANRCESAFRVTGIFPLDKDWIYKNAAKLSASVPADILGEHKEAEYMQRDMEMQRKTMHFLEMHKSIDETLGTFPGNFPISREFLECFDPKAEGTSRWLKDEVVNAYCSLVFDVSKHEIMFVDSIRFQNRMERSQDPGSANQRLRSFSKEAFQHARYIMFAINLNNTHWVCAIAEKATFKLFWIDSFGNSQDCAHAKYAVTFMVDLTRNLGEEQGMKSSWKIVHLFRQQRQTNNVDCGVWVCYIAKMLARGWNVDALKSITEAHVSPFRCEVGYQLIGYIEQHSDDYFSKDTFIESECKNILDVMVSIVEAIDQNAGENGEFELTPTSRKSLRTLATALGIDFEADRSILKVDKSRVVSSTIPQQHITVNVYNYTTYNQNIIQNTQQLSSVQRVLQESVPTLKSVDTDNVGNCKTSKRQRNRYGFEISHDPKIANDPKRIEQLTILQQAKSEENRVKESLKNQKIVDMLVPKKILFEHGYIKDPTEKVLKPTLVKFLQENDPESRYLQQKKKEELCTLIEVWAARNKETQ